jgi:transcriptional regulator with XRE-family HTH domain
MRENMKEGIGKRISKERRKKGWSQAQLAEIMNKNGSKKVISNQIISNWEREYTSPYIDDTIILAKVLGVTYEYLVGEDSRNDLKHILTDREAYWGDYTLTKEEQDTIKRLIIAVLKRE